MRRVLTLVAILALAPVAQGAILPPVHAEAACRTDRYHHDGGKSEPFEREVVIHATDGCHVYEAVTLVARDAGGGSGERTLVIGDANQTWEAGSTIPGPDQVGYCGYAALHQAHLKYRFGFRVPAGTEVHVRYACGG